jgi:hypothetical protein
MRTGSRNSSADAAHSYSTQADLAGHTEACRSVKAQTLKNRLISGSARPSTGYGRRRFPHRNAVMAIDRPAVFEIRSRSTSRNSRQLPRPSAAYATKRKLAAVASHHVACRITVVPRGGSAL